MIPAATFSQIFSPLDTINVGVIGANGMGWSDTNSILKNPNVQCIAICDVDESVRERRKADYAEINSNKVELYAVYRKLLDN